MDDSPTPNHYEKRKYRLHLICYSQPLVVDLFWEGDTVRIEKIKGPEVDDEMLMKLVKTSLLPRTG